MRLTVYSRAWCHLCDELCAALAPIAERYGVPVDVIDVDSDPALDDRYGERVPVVLAGETELCHYRLDAARVIAALDKGLDAVVLDAGCRVPNLPGEHSHSSFHTPSAAGLAGLSNTPLSADPAEPPDNGVRPADFG
jgi:glutaredoxin